jgi:hypothetical protein
MYRSMFSWPGNSQTWQSDWNLKEYALCRESARTLAVITDKTDIRWVPRTAYVLTALDPVVRYGPCVSLAATRVVKRFLKCEIFLITTHKFPLKRLFFCAIPDSFCCSSHLLFFTGVCLLFLFLQGILVRWTRQLRIPILSLAAFGNGWFGPHFLRVLQS